MPSLSALLRVHLPHWLATDAAPGWVMAGTLIVAGLGATALATTTTPARPPRPVLLVTGSNGFVLPPFSVVQPRPVMPAPPTLRSWSCPQTVTLSNGHVHCVQPLGQWGGTY